MYIYIYLDTDQAQRDVGLVVELWVVMKKSGDNKGSKLHVQGSLRQNNAFTQV